MSLIVNKCDGSKEVYLHTKVMGTIASALADSGCYCEVSASRLSEAVTTFLFRRYRNSENGRSVSADEIYAMIIAALSDTDHEQAAALLQEHRLNRRIKRSRTEVVHYGQGAELYEQIPIALVTAKRVKGSIGLQDESCGCSLSPDNNCFTTVLWDKSVIIKDLENKMAVEHNLARTVAAMVEEKVLKMSCRRVLSSVVREIVKNELWQLKQAEANFDYQFAGKPVPAFSPVPAVPAKTSQHCDFAAEGADDYQIISQG
jgi:hypothetical protein